MKTKMLLVGIIVLLVAGIFVQGVLASGNIFKFYGEDVNEFGYMYRIVDTEMGIACYAQARASYTSVLTCVQILPRN